MASSKRNDTPVEVAKVGPAMPAYLAKFQGTDTSLLALEEHRIVPRLKIVQAMSNTELKKEFGEGAVVVWPDRSLLARYDSKDPDSFLLNPLFFFNEFAKWSDPQDSKSPPIVDRTFDKTTELARRCRSAAADRIEPYEGGKYRFTEHLNFVCRIRGGGDLADIAVVLQFRAGEFQTGRNLIGAMFNRKAPMWSQIWEFYPVFRERGAKKWYGLDFRVAQTPFIGEDEVEKAQEAFESFKLLHEKKVLGVDHSDATEERVADLDEVMGSSAKV